MKYMVNTGLAVAAILVVLGGISMGLSGCTTARIPATSFEVPLLDIPLPVILRGENDLRSRPWVEAFQIMHERMRRQYAYGEWKAIDWDALYETAATEIAAAEAEKDRDAWYLALRKYLHSIPDGNVQVDSREPLRMAAEGASTGLALAELADGTVIVSGITEDSPAEAAGIEWGAAVHAWNDKTVALALESTSILWADTPSATPAARRQQQLVWLPRGSEGAASRVTFQNPGEDAPRTMTLDRVEDDFATLDFYRPVGGATELFSSPVERRELEAGGHYIRLAAIAPTLSTPFPVRDFRAAVKAAIDAEAPGLILDLRGTQGGDPSLVPDMLASFATAPAFFETPAEWDADEAGFVVDPEDTVMVEPQSSAYEGPIAVLVDTYTMGPAESLAEFLRERENVTVYGESGTHGSPGIPDLELTLPGGYTVAYPTRRSLDEAGNIQGAADTSGQGNVLPDVRFQMDWEDAHALYVEGVDVVLEGAIAMLGSG